MGNKPQPRELKDRLSAITAELAQIREQLGLPAGEPDMGALRALKHEVDELRVFLWRCVNHVAKTPANSSAAAPMDASFMDSVYRIVDKAGRV